MKTKRLLFVYNAALNPVSLMKDYIIEILPQNNGANIRASCPVVFIENDSVVGKLKLVVSAEEINSITSLQELMRLAKDAVK